MNKRMKRCCVTFNYNANYVNPFYKKTKLSCLINAIDDMINETMA